ncbi:Uncharacterised protein [Salmonella enterica subsp. enterica serovar Bovismorbificans]|uniref:Uncharacterized protein n=1 Tax=Salmonella enterica subsp. enterica serovar Bovismorbificans TaxID=58097 RepID=A0A655EF52_SALET|nr:Uncharacterised protein [Salmonella enterica subsp. enterica serovar Bovismorbificans]CNU96082.1 Uncharacterised protein [Salmonella enterica subsp. enterica serovar Bovismorbificans]CNV17389.1 Uncharacterised protein [Salmonella enterica subsp. enterica serovar Bovismorbificans]
MTGRINALWTYRFKPGPEQLRGFRIPDWLKKNLTIESVYANPFTYELRKRALPFNVYFTKNAVTIFRPRRFHFIDKAPRGRFPHAQVLPVRTITDEKQVPYDVVLM